MQPISAAHTLAAVAGCIWRKWKLCQLRFWSVDYNGCSLVILVCGETFFLSVWDIVFFAEVSLWRAKQRKKKLNLQGNVSCPMYVPVDCYHTDRWGKGVQMVHTKMSKLVKDFADAITYALFIVKINILYIKPFKNIKMIFYWTWKRLQQL